MGISHAIALGLLHGPAELLPVSSSGHVTLIAWLLGWPYQELDPELRKAFEVALHAGTALALVIGLRVEVGEALSAFDRRRLTLVALSFAPVAVAGYSLERPIERHLGTPATIAAGLIVGSLAMAAADRLGRRERTRLEASALDGLALGVAQAFSLIPGVSRNGATLAAARARGFDRADANALSRHVALPVIAGATLLKGARLARLWRGARTSGQLVGAGGGQPTGGVGVAMASGAAAAFASTLAFTWLIGQVERDRSLLPYPAYRLALATVVIRRLRRSRRAGWATAVPGPPVAA